MRRFHAMTYKEAKRILDKRCPPRGRSDADRQLIRDLTDWMFAACASVRPAPKGKA